MLSSRRFVLMMFAMFALAGCLGDEPFKEAYTARGGEEVAVKDMEKTSTFSTTEASIQLVVQLDQRTESLPLDVRWVGPENSFREALEVIVPADTSSLVIGLDLAQSGRTYWTPGEWNVEIRLDGKQVDQVAFNVEGDIPEGATEAEEEQAGDGEFDIDNPTNPFGGPQATPTYNVDQPSNPFGSGGN